MHTQVERRSQRRFRLTLPLVARHPERGSIRAYTRDMSSRGVCFSFPAPIATGAKLKFVLTLPPEVTLSTPIRIQCTGRVVRTEERENSAEITVAAIIDHYDFLAN